MHCEVERWIGRSKSSLLLCCFASTDPRLAVEIIAPTRLENVDVWNGVIGKNWRLTAAALSVICHTQQASPKISRQSNWPPRPNPDRTELMSKSEMTCGVYTTKADITEWNCVQRLVKQTMWTSGVSVTWLGYAWQTRLYLSLQATEIQVAHSAMLWFLYINLLRFGHFGVPLIKARCCTYQLTRVIWSGEVLNWSTTVYDSPSAAYAMWR